jgi:hypothetical protein
MGMSKEEMIREIKKHKDRNGNFYSYVKITGGKVLLEDAPNRFIWAMYERVKNIPVNSVSNQQMEFNFK